MLQMIAEYFQFKTVDLRLIEFMIVFPAYKAMKKVAFCPFGFELDRSVNICYTPCRYNACKNNGHCVVNIQKKAQCL